MVSMLGVGGLAQLMALGFTLLFVVNDIHASANSQVSFRACVMWPSVNFFLIFAVGNAIATMFVPILVPAVIETTWFDQLSDGYRALTYAFIGVVANQTILSNLTYSTVGGSDYSLRERIAKARDRAVEEAIDREIVLENRRQQRRARNLRELLSEEELNAHIFEHLESGTVAKLEAEASNEKAPPFVVKCNALAARKPKEADAIARDAKAHKGILKRLRDKLWF